MNQSTTDINIPVVEPQPAQTKLPTFFTTAYLILFQSPGHLLNLAAVAIRGGLVAPLRHLWTTYFRRVAFEEEGVVMPHSALSFIINALLAFVEIKSQGQPGFPFQTHPQAIMFSVTSLLLYGLASAAEFVIFAAGRDPTSVHAIIARLGKIGSLCILVASLASFFYFSVAQDTKNLEIDTESMTFDRSTGQ